MMGSQQDFPRLFWDILRPLMFQQFLEREWPGEDMDTGIITLLNKKGKENLDYWSPVTLLNLGYKIMAKVFLNRF